MTRKYLLLIVALFSVAVSTACQPGPPNPGFRISMYRTVINALGIPSTFAHQHILLSGQWERDRTGTVVGNLRSFSGHSSGVNGFVNVEHGRAAAVWVLREDNGPCAGQSVAEEVFPGENEDIYCIQTPFFRFNASPAFIDKTNPPTSITITGSGISTAGGTPSVQYWDSYGNMLGEQPAYSVSPDGTWLTGYVPDLANSGVGRFGVRVVNPDGGLAGIAFVDVFNPTLYEPPPPPPGPCYPQTYAPGEANMPAPVCDGTY